MNKSLGSTYFDAHNFVWFLKNYDYFYYFLIYLYNINIDLCFTIIFDVQGNLGRALGLEADY